VYLAENGIHQLSNGENPATKLEQKELFAQMDLAIKSLPPQCRTIFHLVKEQKLKYKEVSKILNLSPRTVETQLVRAMKKLDAIIFPHLTSYRKRSIKNGNKILSIIKSIFF
jgi:RNA polymerase sigma-70 factor (ECF subfamily)